MEIRYNSRLTSARIRAELTAKDAAAALHVSRSAIYMYERGERRPPDDVKVAMAKLYGMTVQDLFFAG